MAEAASPSLPGDSRSRIADFVSSWSGAHRGANRPFEIRERVLQVARGCDGSQAHVARGLKRLQICGDARLAEAVRVAVASRSLVNCAIVASSTRTPAA